MAFLTNAPSEVSLKAQTGRENQRQWLGLLEQCDSQKTATAGLWGDAWNKGRRTLKELPEIKSCAVLLPFWLWSWPGCPLDHHPLSLYLKWSARQRQAATCSLPTWAPLWNDTAGTTGSSCKHGPWVMTKGYEPASSYFLILYLHSWGSTPGSYSEYFLRALGYISGGWEGEP